jgi:diphosphomevalonate decarboxylase
MSDSQTHTTPGSAPLAEVAWRCPSNIALVKYWGKYGVQLPKNPSLSFTLQSAYTDMHIVCTQGTSQGNIEVDFLFEGQAKPSFGDKIEKFLHQHQERFAFLNGHHLRITSSNSFPHSTGIASSASSMGALALCLMSLRQRLDTEPLDDEAFFREASDIARLASGSACRSVYGGVTVWGKHEDVPGSSNTFAVPVNQAIHPVFKDFKNAILIVSSAEKAVSSRAGHALMDGHPMAEARFAQAHQHLKSLLQAMQSGDLSEFIEIVENEALSLHGLMMNSKPSFILMHPNTLALIEKIRKFREDSKISICFTLDAGPNIHLLYPESGLSEAQREAVQYFITHELQALCEQEIIIADSVGSGPQRLI